LKGVDDVARDNRCAPAPVDQVNERRAHGSKVTKQLRNFVEVAACDGVDLRTRPLTVRRKFEQASDFVE
jgi:hypothetical protein